MEFNPLKDLPSFRGVDKKQGKDHSIPSSNHNFGSTCSKWREEKDALFIYQMDKLFKFNDVKKLEIDELVRWKSADVVG